MNSGERNQRKQLAKKGEWLEDQFEYVLRLPNFDLYFKKGR